MWTLANCIYRLAGPKELIPESSLNRSLSMGTLWMECRHYS